MDTPVSFELPNCTEDGEKEVDLVRLAVLSFSGIENSSSAEAVRGTVGKTRTSRT